MNLRWIVMLVSLLLLAACGSDGESGGSSSSGGGDGSKWRVEYSGDLNGEVSGSIMSVVGIASTMTVAGGAIDIGETSAANRAFQARISQLGDRTSVSFRLTLDDGTPCSNATVPDPEQSTVDILDDAADSFRAEISGTLLCGEAREQRIDFTAYLDETA
jgi:hypothetical protein